MQDQVNCEIPDSIINNYTELYAFIEERNGEVSIDYEKYSIPQLVFLSHMLNVWNANQPISDRLHNLHYDTYIEPIIKHREKRALNWSKKYD